MNGPTGKSGRDVEGLQLLSGAGNDMVNFVADDNGGQPGIKLTRRGAATRAAIVQAAAELIYVNGVALTGLDEVLAASATSKSQFYRHFTDKTDLVRAVISFRADEVISRQGSRLQNVDSIRGLQ